MNTLIAITGNARNGKDSIADIIVSEEGFTKKAFAEPMKEALKVIFGWTEEHVNGKLKDVVDPEYGISPRLALQLLGTEFGQEMLCQKCPQFALITGRNLWVKRALCDIEGKKVVFSDLRFLHEAKGVREKNGLIIKVIRPGFEDTSGHISEKEIALIEPAFTIMNDGTLEQLKQKVIDLLELL